MSSVVHHVGEPLPAAVTGGGRDLPPPVFREVKAIMHPRPLWFLCTAALAWLTIALAVWASLKLRNPIVYVLAVAFIATRQNVLALLVHEQVHKVGLNSRLGDYLTNAISAFWLLLTVEGYRKIHLAHHLHYFTDDDPDYLRKQGEEWEFPQPVFMFVRTLLRDASGLNLFKFVSGKSAKRRPADKRELDRAALAFRLAFYALLALVLSLTGTWRLFLVYWVVPLLTVTQLIVRWGAICEHRYNLINPSLAESTPLIILSWWERLLLPNLNFNYHIYHHYFPYISGSDLPRVHAIFKREGLVIEDRVFQGYVEYLRYLFYPPQNATQHLGAAEHAEAEPLAARQAEVRAAASGITS